MSNATTLLHTPVRQSNVASLLRPARIIAVGATIAVAVTAGVLAASIQNGDVPASTGADRAVVAPQLSPVYDSEIILRSATDAAAATPRTDSVAPSAAPVASEPMKVTAPVEQAPVGSAPVVVEPAPAVAVSAPPSQVAAQPEAPVTVVAPVAPVAEVVVAPAAPAVEVVQPAAAVAAPVAAPAAPPSVGWIDAGFTQLMFDEVNAARAAAGLAPVASDPRLVRAATDYAQVLAAENWFSHTGPDGSSIPGRAAAAGYPSDMVGEVIVEGFEDWTAQEFVQLWVESPQHREQMYGPYVHGGMGCISTREQGTLMVRCVMMFGGY
jgi:uncharacterized protein YkwD